MNPENARVYFESGSRHHQAGRLAEAEMAYRGSLLIVPDQPHCMHQYGVLLSQLGRSREAVPLLEKACRLMPEQAAFWNNLGEAYRLADRLVPALHALHRVLQITRRMPEAYYNLGNTLKQMGRHDEAVGAYESALSIHPTYDRAWYNLANTLREAGMLARSVASYREALVIRPDWPEAHLNLANALYELRELDEAIQEYRRAAELKPDDGAITESLGNAIAAQGRTDEAIAEYRRASDKSPGNWVKEFRCELLTPPVLPDRTFIDEQRARIETALTRFEDCGPLPLERLHSSGIEPPMLLAYHGRDDRGLKEQFAEFFARKLPAAEPPPPRAGKPRVGWVVTHGHEGVFARCMGEMVARLNPERIESVVVCSRAGANVLTHLRGGQPFEYFLLPDRVDEAARLLRDTEFDLLYFWEVGTDSFNYFLPFFRPARLQMTGWGWPVTSGNPAIDAFLSSKLLEPANGSDHYTEKLLQLERLPTYYVAPSVPKIPQTNEAFGLTNAEHVYLCQQNIRKYHPDFDGVIAEILDTDSNGVVAMIADEQPVITERLLARLRRSVPGAGNRLKMLERLSREDYLAVVAAADVIIDTPYYGGGANTVLDAVAAGVPIATWEGPFHRGRWAAAVNKHLGLDGLVAEQIDDFAKLAVRLAKSTEAKCGYRQEIESRRNDLFSNVSAVREVEEVFLAMIEQSRIKE